MASKEYIIEYLAREHRVETIVCNVARCRRLTANLADLAQDIYLTLMRYEEEVLVDLWDNEQINFFIVRIAINNLRSAKSPYYQKYINFSRRSAEIKDKDTEKWKSDL